MKADSIRNTKPRAKRTHWQRLVLARLRRHRALALADVADLRRNLALAMADLADLERIISAVDTAAA